jgi:hypothetical protein
MPEIITFDKGIVSKRSPLLLEDGEMVSCEGFSFERDGVLETRQQKVAVNSTALGSIHTMRRYVNNVIAGDGYNVRHKWDLDGYCDQYVPPAGEDFTLLGTLQSDERWSVADHKEFTIIANGLDKKAVVGANLYNWGAANPTTAPSGAAGAAGNPSGTYSLYYTYYIQFPNGRVYETGPSPAGSATVSDQAISWTEIGLCPYETATVWRKLYRYNTTLAETYYVATIKDNTTTTYTDDYLDATLILGVILTTGSYDVPPDGIVDVTDYLNRIFGIYSNYLCWSEAGIPFAVPAANSLLISRSGEDLRCVVSWGDQLYMGDAGTWYRLQGSDSTSWALKQTFAEEGILNPHTAKVTKYGILGLWYDGIYVFDGSTSRNITKDIIKRSTFTKFTDDKDSTAACHAEFDGRHYRLAYPSTATGTTADKAITIDFIDYPNLKVYHSDFVPSAFQYHLDTGIEYMGKADGYQYENTTAETIAVSLQTGDRTMKNIAQLKEVEHLYYDMNTGGAEVILTIYADGVAQTPSIPITESTRKRVRLENLPKWQGYRFSIGITCADAENLKLYSPWVLKANPYGN